MNIFIFFFLAFAGVASATEKPICTRMREATAKGSASARFNQFLTVEYDYDMHESPESATFVGYPGLNDQLDDRSLETLARRDKEALCLFMILNKIPAAKLQGEERVSYELKHRQLEDEIEGAKFFGRYMALDQLGGLHLDFPEMIGTMPTKNKKDYENIIARLNALPKAEEQTEELLREGIKHQATAVQMFLLRVPDQFEKLLPEKYEESALYAPFKTINSSLSEGEKLDLRNQAASAIQNKVYPAFEKLKKFVITEYTPHARADISMSHLPNGEAWYAYQVRMQTTTKLNPAELHAIGISEVARIEKEMEALKTEAKFGGDLTKFNKWLVTAKEFEFDTPQALLMAFRDLAKRIDAELPKLFKTLPRLTYGVKEIPEYKAADSSAAYYMPGSPDSGRAGFFNANTSDVHHRPSWMMAPLTLHEAVPGHHLQIALAQEIPGLPKFRQNALYNAFVEGWGLYAESLGNELGLYHDPYAHYGQLTFEMWRSIRLVVDTGIHSLGWTREQAIKYFNDHMAKPGKEVEVEVDRYITWPGQALGYKVGQLKFLELRERAKKVLGDKFDIREFHDAVLLHGAMPLDVLEKGFNEWLTAQQKNLSRTK